jgi:cytochrome c oxidase cbb3-type subunit 3
MRRASLKLMALAGAAALGACKREERPVHTLAPSSSASQWLRLSPLQPGEPIPTARVVNTYDQNAYAISEGKTLFSAFNCAGCHGRGGGGMGPALMDDEWVYGSGPEQIYATITQGRPNGMPSFGGKVTDDQVWKLVAYVRSLSGLVSKDAAPGRDDAMTTKPPENSVPRAEPRNSGIPKSAEMPR